MRQNQSGTAIPEQPTALQLLRLPEVERQTGIKSTHIYGLIRLGKFPRPVKLGPRASAWVSGEVQGWIAARIAESRK